MHRVSLVIDIAADTIKETNKFHNSPQQYNGSGDYDKNSTSGKESTQQDMKLNLDLPSLIPNRECRRDEEMSWRFLNTDERERAPVPRWKRSCSPWRWHRIWAEAVVDWLSRPWVKRRRLRENSINWLHKLAPCSSWSVSKTNDGSCTGFSSSRRRWYSKLVFFLFFFNICEYYPNNILDFKIWCIKHNF